MGKTIGIDLGTTGSLAAYAVGREIKVIVNAEGSRITPSVVAFTDEGRLVGRAAKSQAVVNPTRTISSAKRLIGHTRAEAAEAEKLLPYKVVGEPNEPALIEVDGKRYFPAEISAMVLQDIKKSAERVLGEVVNSCVLCVPAYFSDSQRVCSRQAAQIAGMEVKRVLSEPTAAALAYGLDKNEDEKIIVLDFGGGTHDVSVMVLGGGVFQVIATSGDVFLGGDDFDRVLVNYVADEFQKTSGCDIRKDQLALQRLLEACERAKCDLSTLTQAVINLPYVTAENGVPKHLSVSITRTKFEQLAEPLFTRFRAPITKALQDAKLMPSQINQVVLVGGSSRIPKIVEICKEIFGKEPNQGVNPDEAVAIGAAVSGALLGDEPNTALAGVVLVDVTPLSLGVEVQGLTNVIIPRNSPIPCSKSECFTTSSDNQPAVDIHVLQGEHQLVAGNKTLGRFQLAGIPPMRRNMPEIEVTFDINADGILNVTAKDKTTGKSHKVEIKSSSGLDKSQIERMVQDAQLNAADEASKVELIKMRNQVDATVYGVESFLRDNEKSVSITVASSVAGHLDQLKKLMDSNADRTALSAGLDNLDRSAKQMYEQVFGNKAVAPQAPPTAQAVGPAPARPSGVANVGDTAGPGFKV